MTAAKLAIIPVYNQIGTIGKVLSKFSNNVVDEICLIIDCPTEVILNEINSSRTNIPIHLIKNPKRMGIGYAIRQGIEYSLDRRYDIIVVMAGNNKDDPNEITRLVTPIIEADYDYVQGSRFLSGGRSIRNPFLRGIFSRLYPFIWTLFTGFWCTDVTNGFRAYKTSIFNDKNIDIKQSWLNGYALEYYVHYKVIILRYNVREVPVSKSYPYRHKGGYSKISPLRDWWQIVGPLFYLGLGIRD